jgi:hypothetical protein
MLSLPDVIGPTLPIYPRPVNLLAWHYHLFLIDGAASGVFLEPLATANMLPSGDQARWLTQFEVLAG